MNVLFDTNVVLDVLLRRMPFAIVSARLVARVERAEVVGIVGATTLTTLHYLVAKVTDRETAIAGLRRLLGIFRLAPVDRTVLELAAVSMFADFEDAVLHEAGRLAGAEVVVTRNPEDFRAGSLRVLTPGDLEAILGLHKSP